MKYVFDLVGKFFCYWLYYSFYYCLQNIFENVYNYRNSFIKECDWDKFFKVFFFFINVNR